MTTIANSAGVFARLGYNFDDPNETIQNLSAETQAQPNLGSGRDKGGVR